MEFDQILIIIQFEISQLIRNISRWNFILITWHQTGSYTWSFYRFQTNRLPQIFIRNFEPRIFAPKSENSKTRLSDRFRSAWLLLVWLVTVLLSVSWLAGWLSRDVSPRNSLMRSCTGIYGPDLVDFWTLIVGPGDWTSPWTPVPAWLSEPYRRDNNFPLTNDRLLASNI